MSVYALSNVFIPYSKSLSSHSVLSVDVGAGSSGKVRYKMH